MWPTKSKIFIIYYLTIYAKGLPVPVLEVCSFICAMFGEHGRSEQI